MNEQDYLFYSYVGTWDKNVLPYTRNYPNSVVFHPETQRIMHNGIIYGNGASSEDGPYFIKGTNANDDTSGHWTSTHKGIEKYKEGLTIIFLPNVAGSTSQTTLNINNLGARNCYFDGTNALTQQYSVGTPILLTYVGSESTGTWKRADMDTTQTPVSLALSGTTFYFNLTNVTNGLTDLYTMGSNLYYDFTTKTIYSENFDGNLNGNVTGNAGSATKLLNSHTLWGQTFDGTQDVSGNISNTGNITPTTTNTYNIGGATSYYNQVFGKYFKGRADGVASKQFSSSYAFKKIYLLGHQEDQIGAVTGSGEVNVNPNVYITEDSLLHATYLRCGNSTAFNSNNKLFVNGKSKLDGEVECTNNVTISGTLGVGTTNTAGYKAYINGSLYVANDVYGDAFIKHGGAVTQVLLANGTVKDWTTTATASAIVARDDNGHIYGKRYYTDINDEDLTISSVYVASTDNAIRKVSYDKFMAKTFNSTVIEIPKSLRVTIPWMDTGITTDETTFPEGNGTYVVQLDATAINNATDGYASIYSGIMTVYNGTDNTTETEEIILHRSGKGTCRRLYLRTIPTASGTGYCKLQIATSGNQPDPSNSLSGALSQAYNLKFKFKKII